MARADRKEPVLKTGSAASLPPRRRLATAGVAMLAAGGLGLATPSQSLQGQAAAAASRKPPAPNIVLVMTDDQALSQVGPFAITGACRAAGSHPAIRHPAPGYAPGDAPDR